MRMTSAQRGLTLIELMVTLTLLGIVLATVAPGFGRWIANTRVRTAAEELQNALRLAQTEAVRRNRQMVFVLTNDAPSLTSTPTANANNWVVRALPLAGETADSTFFAGGGTFAKAQSVSVTGAAIVCFNSLGRQVANSSTGLGSDCAAPGASSNYNVSSPRADRPMRVQTFRGGRIRMCDPAKTLSATVPDGC
jgi:type IV fimbrial biogenesis protein FimT